MKKKAKLKVEVEIWTDGNLESNEIRWLLEDLRNSGPSGYTHNNGYSIRTDRITRKQLFKALGIK